MGIFRNRCCSVYFYPRPPRGGRLRHQHSPAFLMIFLSTPSARRATTHDLLVRIVQQFLSTPSARRATLSTATIQHAEADFYPRPPRGGRLPVLTQLASGNQISIHALREEGDQMPRFLAQSIVPFLSTPSARRATFFRMACSPRFAFLSTPSARRATFNEIHKTKMTYISIHALREEGDDAATPDLEYILKFLSTPSARRATYTETPSLSQAWIFLSTPSARRATICYFHAKVFDIISIHALREEGDIEEFAKFILDKKFLSTPSARRATDLNFCRFCFFSISIHALREEGDASLSRPTMLISYFYPRPPRGGRLKLFGKCQNKVNFYPRPPRGGRHRGQQARGVTNVFLSTPSARRATQQDVEVGCHVGISIHALREEGDASRFPLVRPASLFLSTPSARRAT